MTEKAPSFDDLPLHKQKAVSFFSYVFPEVLSTHWLRTKSTLTLASESFAADIDDGSDLDLDDQDVGSPIARAAVNVETSSAAVNSTAVATDHNVASSSSPSSLNSAAADVEQVNNVDDVQLSDDDVHMQDNTAASVITSNVNVCAHVAIATDADADASGQPSTVNGTPTPLSLATCTEFEATLDRDSTSTSTAAAPSSMSTLSSSSSSSNSSTSPRPSSDPSPSTLTLSSSSTTSTSTCTAAGLNVNSPSTSTAAATSTSAQQPIAKSSSVGTKRKLNPQEKANKKLASGSDHEPVDAATHALATARRKNRGANVNTSI